MLRRYILKEVCRQDNMMHGRTQGSRLLIASTNSDMSYDRRRLDKQEPTHMWKDTRNDRGYTLGSTITGGVLTILDEEHMLRS
jgi:hypothetical protein